MTELLENLSIRPDPEASASLGDDLLSHVLAQVRLTGDRVTLRTFGADEPIDLDPRAAHVFVVTAGALQIECGDEPGPGGVETGELMLLPHGTDAMRIVAGRSGATIIICRFWFDPHSLRGMTFALPRRIRIQQSAGAGWLEGIVHFMMIEASDVQPGAALMISRLIDLIVIRVLRSWAQRDQPSGWFGGLSDPRVARSLKAMHAAPMRQWSVGDLAAIAGMSRSNFCDRFAALVGRSPLRYQNEWRLTLARGLLAQPDARVGEIGLSIGYASEAAFSRAYKAFFGHSPRMEQKCGRDYRVA